MCVCVYQVVKWGVRASAAQEIGCRGEGTNEYGAQAVRYMYKYICMLMVYMKMVYVYKYMYTQSCTCLYI